MVNRILPIARRAANRACFFGRSMGKDFFNNVTSACATLFPTLLQKLGHQRRPSGLVAGTQSRAIVPMKIFVKRYVVAEMWIGLELLSAPENRAAAVLVS